MPVSESYENIKESESFYRFLSNRHVKIKESGSRLTGKKHIFFDERYIIKCSVARIQLTDTIELKAQAKNTFDKNFRGFASISVNEVCSLGQDVEPAPIDGFNSHAHIVYNEEYLPDTGEPLNPEFLTILKSLELKANYLLDSNIDEPDFICKRIKMLQGKQLLDIEQ